MNLEIQLRDLNMFGHAQRILQTRVKNRGGLFEFRQLEIDESKTDQAFFVIGLFFQLLLKEANSFLVLLRFHVGHCDVVQTVWVFLESQSVVKFFTRFGSFLWLRKNCPESNLCCRC